MGRSYGCSVGDCTAGGPRKTTARLAVNFLFLPQLRPIGNPGSVTWMNCRKSGRPVHFGLVVARALRILRHPRTCQRSLRSSPCYSDLRRTLIGFVVVTSRARFRAFNMTGIWITSVSEKTMAMRTCSTSSIGFRVRGECALRRLA